MSKIFCIIGKSATGKDTLYKKLLETAPFPLKTIVSYTTRPIRDGETNGIEYFFVSVERYFELLHAGLVIEHRCYHTILGDWYYFTVNDGQIQLTGSNYLVIMTLEGFEQLQQYYGEENVIPLYIEVEDGERLSRALKRERMQSSPKYTELCRRFLADDTDFSEENIKKLKIKKRYENIDMDNCLQSILLSLEELSGQSSSPIV